MKKCYFNSIQSNDEYNEYSECAVIIRYVIDSDIKEH